MKQGNNNEVDLLLRVLARGRDESRPPSGSNPDGTVPDHLDADELNSYAEGVVPPPARARYLEHLADCEACRGIVISLTQAAGVAGRYEVQQQAGGANFWQKLAAVFSPAVLRFAVPALVLTAVIGIGLFALRQRNEFLARNNEPAPLAADSGKADSTSNPPAGATPPSSSGIQTATKTGSENQQKTLQDEKTEVAQRQITDAESPPAKPAAPKDLAQPGEGAATGGVYALEPKAAAPPATVMREEADKSAELAKEQPAKRADQQRGQEVTRAQDEVRNQPNEDDGHGPYRARNNTASPAANERNLGMAGGRGPSVDKKKVSSAVETRSVSGRRFAREDNVWVDTDYDAPRSTTKVTRGSDQFRALVADEPGLRAIADQLSGVVIVVWKNRAYRIQ